LFSPPDAREVPIVRIWSELRAARAKEQLADAATAAWVIVWTMVAVSLFQVVEGFGAAGRTIRDGGEGLVQSGRDLGAALAGIPVVGEGLRGVAERAFAGAGAPMTMFGLDLEQLIATLAATLALLVLAVPLIPWLSRYVPWRWARLRALRAGHRAIRVAPAPDLGTSDVQQVLALRAVARLDYAELLDFTPDPIGDWVAGRHDRLAQAELASVGLRP
jgi:hypothetical protein